jgi:hypothetical protein
MMDQDEYLQLGDLIARASMHAISKWHESVGFWSNLHPPATKTKESKICLQLIFNEDFFLILFLYITYLKP